MKRFKLFVTIPVLFCLSFQVQAKEELAKNCHKVKSLTYEACMQSNTKRGCGSRLKIVCDKVKPTEELQALIESREEANIFKCLKSIATNKKTVGIIPIGQQSEDKFEIKDHSLLADQSKREHVVVDAKKKQVQKCKFNGESKVCSRATWSDLKKILKDNISISKAAPFKSIKEKFEKKNVDLNVEKSDFESKESFVNNMPEADGEGVKKYLENLEASNSENASLEKKKWKKIFAQKLGVNESDFSNLAKLKTIKKAKIAQALQELRDEKKKEILDLPRDEIADKELYIKKMEKVSESAKNGKKLCSDIGFDSLVSEIKNKGNTFSSTPAQVASVSQK